MLMHYILEFYLAIKSFMPMIFIGFGIGIFSLLVKHVKEVFLWLKQGIENGDGKLENKELQIVFFSLLAAFEIIMIAFYNAQFPEAVIWATFGLAGVAYTANRGFAVMPKKQKKDDEVTNI